MLKALLVYDEHPAFFDLPHSPLAVEQFTLSVGHYQPYTNIFLLDNNDLNQLQVKLIADNAADYHLQYLFAEDSMLSTVNTVCDMFYRLPVEKQIDLTHSMTDSKINNEKELLDAIKDIMTEARDQAQQRAGDKFYINHETGSVRWLYYNPDSSAGGQYVELVSDFGLIREAADADDDFFVYLEGCCKGYLIDVGTEEFPLYDNEFNNDPCDFEGCSEDTKDALIAAANAGLNKRNNRIESPAMSIVFSRVKLWSQSGEEAVFFISGEPDGYEDMEDHEDCIDFKEFLEQKDNPNLQRVILCLDNDDAGRQAMDRIAEKLSAKGYTDVSILLPTEPHKDWNESLQADCGKLKVAPVQESAEDEQTGGMVMQ